MWLRIIISVIVIVGLGSLSGLFTVTEIETWYAGLQKPPFNPPNWVFGPVWTTLYVLMAIAFALVWQRQTHTLDPTERRAAGRAMALFVAQFIFNLAWSFIFFNRHLILGALVEMLILWVLIVITIVRFFRVNKVSGILMLPYIAWVTFAFALNLGIFIYN